MAQVGDKFVIEIGSVVNGEESGCPQYRVKGFDKVFFDDKGLKNLDKYEEPDKIGAEIVWDFANKIMNIPIHERAEMFGVSHNNACFKDISEKFSFEEAMDKYKEYIKKKTDKSIIENKLLYFAKENNMTIKELKQLLRGDL